MKATFSTLFLVFGLLGPPFRDVVFCTLKEFSNDPLKKIFRIHSGLRPSFHFLAAGRATPSLALLLILFSLRRPGGGLGLRPPGVMAT